MPHAAAEPPTPIRPDPPAPGPERAVETTLLELVGVLCEVTRDDAEVVATVVELIRAGRIRLTGAFRGREAQLAGDPELAALRAELPTPISRRD